MAQTVKHLPTIRETQVRSLGREDPLEKEMATHSSIFAWRISWTEEPGGLQSTGSQRVGHDWGTNTFTYELWVTDVKKQIYDYIEINLEYWLEGLMLERSSNTLATWYKELTHWEKLWCWDRLKAKVEGVNRGWDCWIASPTQWTWIWANSGR